MATLPEQIHLTDQQRRFVEEFVDAGQGDYAAAALASGYAPRLASSARNWVTRTPQVLAAIHLEVAKRLQEGAPIALKVLIDMAKDKDTPQKIRLDASKAILDRAGHIAPRAAVLGAGGEKTLGEMSLDELKATQERLNNELANRAKPVNAQPVTLDSDNDADLIG